MSEGAAEAWRGYKRGSYGLLDLTEGDQLLDVGCGTGEDARELARLHPGVAVVGVDLSAERVAEAARLTLGIPRPVDFQVADAYRLPFETTTFDAVRADKVFHHLDDPGRALAEMVRVARPGGRVVVTDADYETLVIQGGDPAVGRRIVQRHTERLPHGRIGRRLHGLFLDAGLADVELVPFTVVVTEYDEEVLKLAEKAEDAATAGAIAGHDAARWVEELEAAGRASRFLCALTLFSARGRVP